MEHRPLTTWEQKERDGLLAHETDEWREKRLVAEDPNTSGEVLVNLYEDIVAHWTRNTRNDDYKTHDQPDTLAETLAAHPNTALCFSGTHRQSATCNPCVLP